MAPNNLEKKPTLVLEVPFPLVQEVQKVWEAVASLVAVEEAAS